MLELPHTLVGITLATKIPNPLIALPLAFISGFLLDMLPHWNPHLYTEMTRDGKVSRRSTLICFADSGLALIFGLFFAFRFWPDWPRVVVILAGCFLAALPDLIEAPYFFLGIKNNVILKFIHFQRKLQWNVPFVPGVLSQVVLLGICFWLLLA